MKRAALLAITWLFGLCASAQNEDPYKKLRFGFNLGMHYSITRVELNPKGRGNVKATNGRGFRLGVLLDRRLNRNWSFSPKAELAFNKSRISARQADSSKIICSIYPTAIELAAHLQYKIKEWNTSKLHVLLGPNWKLPIWDPSKGLQTARPDLAIDLGIGAELPTERFIIAPELRYSWGLVNLYDDPEVRSVYLHSITLVINFK